MTAHALYEENSRFLDYAFISSFMKIYEFSNYREFLRAALAERIQNNPSYSLRAFARDCGLGSSTLSGAMNGRSNLSIGAALKIAGILKLEKQHVTYLYDLVSLELQKDARVRKTIMERLRKNHPQKRELTDLTVEQFKQMSEWYHSAIMELPRLKNFIFNEDNTAKILGISLPTAQLAIGRLKKLEILEEDKSGNIARKNPETRVTAEIKSSAFRAFYRQMFQKASAALDTQTPQERLSGYLTIPINPKALKEVDDLISKFFEDVRGVSEKYGSETEVYHMMIHFFNLTKRKKEKPNENEK